MSMEVVTIGVLAVILALAWIPVGLFFWKTWRKRRSPLSLAISALATYPVFTNVSTFMLLTGNAISSATALMVANFVLLLNFAMCFNLHRKFPDQRRAS